MSNGYLAAATADREIAEEIGYGLDLDLVRAGSPGENEAAAARMAQAPNVGLVLSHAAMRDTAFVSLLQTLAGKLARAQLIVVEADAANAFAFLPADWPTMQLADALRIARISAERRNAPTEQAPVQAAPMPAAPPAAAPEPEPEPEPPAPAEAAEPSPEPQAAPEPEAAPEPDTAQEPAPEVVTDETAAASEAADVLASEDASADDSFGETESDTKAPEAEEVPAPAPAAPSRAITVPKADEPRADDGVVYSRAPVEGTVGGRFRAHSVAPADATAFAPKKLRRGEAELVRIAIHQPKDLQAVIKAAKKADPRTDGAPQSMGIGEIEIGSAVGVALEVKGASCDGTLQQRTWRGEPLDFSFAVEPDADAKQAVILARVFVNDAQIGVLAFTRPISAPANKPHGEGERVRLHRFKRVFISYSSADRETVATIATAYEMAGVPHFFDRTSLKSGEEWGPRLQKEIEKADLFHLCWSKAAATSEWVEKEAEFALARNKKSKGKQPAITVQMLDGPPWAPHPPHLDAINFDDFVRAAIVGYARGEG